ncbi:Retrotransposon gag protein [Arachis hypogaea]|nr:Retrotransposon gag protein [Arachis hypogaea]
MVKVGKYFLPTDFVVLEMEESYLHLIILGRPFLATGRALIDVEQGELILRIHDEQFTFHVFKPSHDLDQEKECMKDDLSDTNLKEAPIEPSPENLKSHLKEKEEVKVTLQTKEIKEELGSQLSHETRKKDPHDTGTGVLLEEGKRVGKKTPKGWKNKKIPTEDFFS